MKRPQSPTMSLDEVASFPRPGTVVPTSLAFSPDGREVTYLHSENKSLTKQLYALQIFTGECRQLVNSGGNTEDNLSAEQKLERERRRERGLGVTGYTWSAKGGTLLLPLAGALHVQKGTSGELQELSKPSQAPLLSPQLSKDGSMLAYVCDDELYVQDCEGGTPRQLTTGARGTGKKHGLAEYIAQEEMDRYQGFWWSDDGKYIGFTQIDETHIPAYRIMHQGKQEVGAGAQEDHGYPFAGQANAKVKLAVVPVAGGAPLWMDLGPSEDIYLARVHWMPNGELWAQTEDREQKQLTLLRFDMESGAAQPILVEQSNTWINLHHGFRALLRGKGELEGGFLWASERSGFLHLYLYSAEGKLVRTLTQGDWLVDSVVAVDEDSGRVYYLSGNTDPTQKQLYVVDMQSAVSTRITSEAGTHQACIDASFTHFIDTHESTARPPSVCVRRLDNGQRVQSVYEEVDPRIAELALQGPELVTLLSRDGVTLHGAIYKPPAHFEAPYPTLVSVYGGPHAQRVSDDWNMSADLRAQYLSRQGFLVFKLDNRGSARRGLAFESAIAGDMGNIEVQDQVDGVHWLIEKGLCSAGQVGIYGWSYGGYLSAMALARAPETFQVAVAGAPVTHWDGYDSHYTERYMGTPASNPQGYEQSAVMHHVQGMSGKLMLVHGLIDENVHFRHSARLINALIEAQKDYELLLFPDERHMPRGQKDRVYMERRMSDFFARHLRA